MAIYAWQNCQWRPAWRKRANACKHSCSPFRGNAWNWSSKKGCKMLLPEIAQEERRKVEPRQNNILSTGPVGLAWLLSSSLPGDLFTFQQPAEISPFWNSPRCGWWLLHSAFPNALHLYYSLFHTFRRCSHAWLSPPLDREILWGRGCAFIFIHLPSVGPASLGIMGQSQSSGVCISYFSSCENLKQVSLWKYFSLGYNSLLRTCTKVNTTWTLPFLIYKKRKIIPILEVVAICSLCSGAYFLNEGTQFCIGTEVWPRHEQRDNLAWSLNWMETWLIKSYQALESKFCNAVRSLTCSDLLFFF